MTFTLEATLFKLESSLLFIESDKEKKKGMNESEKWGEWGKEQEKKAVDLGLLSTSWVQSLG